MLKKITQKIPKESGVYKITSPTNRIYIGSSKNLYSRYCYYRNNNAPNQTILNYSFNKYGFENHKFEILEICKEDERLFKESFYGNLYNSLSSNGGLNLIIPKSNQKPAQYSEELKEKFRNIAKVRTYSKETLNKMSVSKINYFKNNDNHLNKIIIDINTGIFYKSVKEASYYNNFTRTNLSEYLNGKRKGKINLKYA